MLHILDGESSAATLAQTQVPGEKFAWREALLEGPTPAGVEGDAWLELRARHLSEHYGLEFDECHNKLREQEDTLGRLRDHDEVVLWFEHDLFCQTNLIYLLDWCSRNDVTNKTKLSLICIDRFPGIENFRGLGQLNRAQLASLFPKRQEVTWAQLETASACWAAYRAPQPTAISTLIHTDLSALPFLKRALQIHLARFPSTRNGLGMIENTALQLIADGFTRFVDLFRRFGELQSGYGLGDLQLWVGLRRLTECAEPLLKRQPVSSTKGVSPERVRESSYELTAAGRDVLRSAADFVKLNGINHWLGGVHLSGKQDIWRWDEQKCAAKLA